MDYVLIALGALLYVAIVIDIIKTTVSLHAGGWLTTPLSNIVWKVIYHTSGRNGRSALLEHAGYIILLWILLLWVLALWGSFFLLLLSQNNSVISSSEQLPADAWQKLYYAGFTLSTLGVGDYIATSNLWRMLTTLYSFTGLWLITMSITYFFSVLSGVVNDRQLGVLLSSLGKTPQQVLLNSWNGKTFDRLVKQASDLATLLVKHTQNHKAYPVIHYFHTSVPKHVTILRIATLYEAMVLLKHFVRPEIRPDTNDLSALQAGLDNYGAVISDVTGSEKHPEAPEIRTDRLVEAGLIDRVAVADIVLEKKVQENRMLLLHLVEGDGWRWRDDILEED